jgi:Flp pilus assembly protein TadG
MPTSNQLISSYKMPKSQLRSSHIKYSFGAILIETAIVIPFLLLVTVGVINIGSIIWQIQAIMEGARVGSRKAANLTNDSVSCVTIQNEAKQVYNQYVLDYGKSMGITLSSSWAPPQACFKNATYNGYTRTLIKVSVSTQPTNNCVLCMMNLLSYIPINISRSFVLEWGCSQPENAEICAL